MAFGASYAGDFINGVYMPKAALERYDPEALAALGAEQLRGIVAFENERSKHQAQVKHNQHIRAVLRRTPEPRKLCPYRNPVKLWPLLGLAAIRSGKTSGWRAWILAKDIDRKAQGSGKIAQNELRAYLDRLGVNKRTQRRWIAQAKALGLLVERKDIYYLASVAKAAIILGCAEIGKPAIIDAGRLVDRGWRAFAWAAYLVTLKGKPISQKTKEAITGIGTRTQRVYQRKAPGRAVKNIRRVTGPQAKAIRINPKDFYNRHFYIDDQGQVIQRLPDSWLVNANAAMRHGCPGRSKKIQSKLAPSFDLERAQCKYRIFQKSHKAAIKAQRSKGNYSANNRPDELFYRVYKGNHVNRWEALDLTFGDSVYAIL